MPLPGQLRGCASVCVCTRVWNVFCAHQVRTRSKEHVGACLCAGEEGQGLASPNPLPLLERPRS